VVDAPNAGGGRSFDVLRSASALPTGEVWAAGQYQAGGLWRTLIERCPA